MSINVIFTTTIKSLSWTVLLLWTGSSWSWLSLLGLFNQLAGELGSRINFLCSKFSMAWGEKRTSIELSLESHWLKRVPRINLCTVPLSQLLKKPDLGLLSHASLESRCGFRNQSLHGCSQWCFSTRDTDAVTAAASRRARG